MCECRKCVEWHVAAKLLVRSCSILSKLSEVEGCTFPRKPVAPCCKAFQASLSLSPRARSNSGYLNLWDSEQSGLDILRTKLWELHMNENARPFLSSALTKFFMRANLKCRVWSNTWQRSARGWWTTLFVPGVIYVKASSFWPGEQFWHDNPFRVRNRILCSPVAVLSKWQLPSNHCEYAIDVSCISHIREFSSWFHVSLLWPS